PGPEHEKHVGLLRNSPACKASGDINDVLLRVPAIDPQCVKLHEFAPVVFVEARSPCGSRLRCWSRTVRSRSWSYCWWCLAEEVVKIIEHRWALRRCEQQLLELAECVRTNDVPFERRQQITVGILAGEDIEVVEPEVSHHLQELLV